MRGGGNFPIVLVLHALGSEEQQQLIEPLLRHEVACAFGLTEPDHGSDATWLETRAVRDGDEWIINGAKRFNTGMHQMATHDLVFARTSGEDGHARGITAFLVPTDTPGLEVPYHHWTFNMPTDHAEVILRDVRVPHTAIVGQEGAGLAAAMLFVHENRIRQAAYPASGRPQFLRRSQRPGTPGNGPPSAGRWPSTRRSSGRSSSCTPTARSCAS